MSINFSTPWHKASFDRFIQERLPQLLAERLPLVGYQVQSTGRYTCRIVVALAFTPGDIETVYDIPQPNEDGIFEIEGVPRVVVPTASNEELDTATFHCVGEQLYEYIQEHVGQAPADLPWDAELVRAWLPLDTWIDAFLRGQVRPQAQWLDTSNWLSRHTHLRRIYILDCNQVVAPGQAGLVCPFETPEGPYLGRIFTVAVGAEIRDEKLVLVDDRPEATLGVCASMIPFLEHSDPNRLLMAAPTMRQVFAPPDPEPALVQTGNEPDAPDFWCGRNLLTAFISWGAETFADSIVVSQSCARRLNYPYPVEPGDKLCNRHGTIGVVSRVLPDDEMPHLADGTPLELVFNFFGLHVRMNFGQLRESVMGRIARAEGTPAIVPPFGAPSADELRARLARAGLPESGMETLTLGRGGPQLERPSTVGWIYWNRMVYLAKDKLQASVDGAGGQVQGEYPNMVLRDLGAFQNLGEILNTRAARRRDAPTLAARAAAGPVEPASPPTPMFSDLVERLRLGGIRATLESGKLTFCFDPPQSNAPGGVLNLACPLPHPWLRERQLTQIGTYTDELDANDRQVREMHAQPYNPSDPSLLPMERYKLLVEANKRLARMLSSQTPAKLTQDAVAQLETRLSAFFDALLQPAHLCFEEQQLFSGRAVIAPGASLRLDQVGLADEIAWTLFGPLVTRELGDADAVLARSERAAQALDEVMARSWVVIVPLPTHTPIISFLAFRPVRNPGHVIRLHPLACDILNTDFDGDQVAVSLPITPGAQREAGERLTIAGRLAHDPKLVRSLLPPPEALWGLSNLNLTPAGRQEILKIAGVQVAAFNGVITQTTLAEAMQKVLERDGVEAVLTTLDKLMRRGFEAVQASGASMSPFLGASLPQPPQPQKDDAELWSAYTEELAEKILSGTDYTSADLGPQLLAVSVRERGRYTLPRLIGPWGAATDIRGKSLIIRHSNIEGLTPEEMVARMVGARQALGKYYIQWEQLSQEARERGGSGRFTVLARARRARRPGIVFARAAAIGETDPLMDMDSRLWVGLPIVT